MYRMTLKDGTVYDLADDGAVLARSDGPGGWDYSGRWIITGFGTRSNSHHLVTLAEAADGIDFGQGWVHDLDHGAHRMWGSPTGRRLARIVKVPTLCDNCDEPIYYYIHSQFGTLKAGAWTTIPEDSEDDQRNGTFCSEAGAPPWVHSPAMP